MKSLFNIIWNCLCTIGRALNGINYCPRNAAEQAEMRQEAELNRWRVL